MKTNHIITIAAALTMGISGSAFGMHNESHREQQRELQRHRTSRVQPAEREQKENVFVSTVAYPFRLLGRTGRSVMNTPTIVGETWNGDRSFISKRGIMASREDKIERRNLSDRTVSGEDQRTVPKGRGERRQLFPND